MNDQKRNERMAAFTEAATQMVTFLRKHGDPHCTVTVTQTGAEMLCGEIGMPYPYPEEDPSPEFYDQKPKEGTDAQARWDAQDYPEWYVCSACGAEAPAGQNGAYDLVSECPACHACMRRP